MHADKLKPELRRLPPLGVVNGIAEEDEMGWILDVLVDVAANNCGYTVFESSGTLEGDGAIASNFQCRGEFPTKEQARLAGEYTVGLLVIDEKMNRVVVLPGHSRF